MCNTLREILLPYSTLVRSHLKYVFILHFKRNIEKRNAENHVKREAVLSFLWNYE